jgi:hypothetical protein
MRVETSRRNRKRLALSIIGVAFGLCSWEPVSAEQAASAPVPNEEQLSSDAFDASRRTILTGRAGVRLVELEGVGRALFFKPVWPNLAAASREISETDLDDLERVLLPGLIADLKWEGSPIKPSQYFRQYAAATWDGGPAIFVSGFHELYFSGHGKHQADWQHVPIENSGGGRLYWYGVYLADSHKFVPLQTVHLRHPEYFGTVRFHLVGFFDCAGKDRECEELL